MLTNIQKRPYLRFIIMTADKVFCKRGVARVIWLMKMCFYDVI